MKSVHPVLAELYRMSCTKVHWLALVLPALTGVARIGASRMAERLERARRVAQGMGGEGDAAALNGFGPLADGMRTGGAVLALIALIMGALIWVRDRESGTLRLQVLVRRRSAVLLGKALVLAVFLTAAMGFLAVGCIAASAAWYDLGPIVEDGFEMATAAELWSDTSWAIAAALPALLASACFGLLVSTLTSTTGAAVAGTLVPFVLFDLLQGLVEEQARFVFVRYVPFLGEHSTLARLTEVARAYSDAGWQVGELQNAALIPGLQVLALAAVACLVARARPL